jgi:hypothetical protein
VGLKKALKCYDCKDRLPDDSVAIYLGEDGNTRCQLCDQEYEEKLLIAVANKYWKGSSSLADK